MADFDNTDDIKNYYSANNEDDRHKTQQLEFLVTERLLKKIIQKSSAQILEIGAGSGYYTRFLASHGHQVTAVDFVPELIEQNQQQLKGIKSSAVKLYVTDARDLSSIVETDFDYAFLMGPLYHLTKYQDRLQALQQAQRKTKETGMIASTFLTRVGLISYMLHKYPQWILQANEEALHMLKKGENKNHTRDGSFRGHFSTLSQIEQLHEEAGLKIQSIYPQDPCIAGADAIFNTLPTNLKIAWVDFLSEMHIDPLSLGSGRTILVSASRG